MIYPHNFESKIGFGEIRSLLIERCLSSLGREKVESLSFSDDAETINMWLDQVREFRRLKEEHDNFPLAGFYDVRLSVGRIRIEGTYMEEEELFDLKRSLEAIQAIVDFLSDATYPALYLLTEGIETFPHLVKRIDEILDKYGRIKDEASKELGEIRRELAKTEGSISTTLNRILRAAQSDGLVEKDTTPTMRDGRLVIPVAPGLKRRIKGIVHDESASGKTVFIEPAEVVETNNRIRELENDERREIIRILTEFSKQVRPAVQEIIDSCRLLADIDLIQAKAALAERIRAIEPEVRKMPGMDWIHATHPLLQLAFEKQHRSIVPLDISLSKESRLLIISGPNAGGKSVCLKTAGLLQYMLQCGLSVPMSDRSQAGVFGNIMIDIGDEQSIENDLSTYSSHLTNMKQMIRHADSHTLLLIDEFGTGTEPMIGGAIAEAVLQQFWQKRAFAIVTTHYQNLKQFAESHAGVTNGAMLYDRHQMQPLFQLAIGQPGSSFAIEIARKIGLPEEVINDAGKIVGSEYIQSDKYLQDIVRDRRYWEGKRQTIHQREKDIERAIARYETHLDDIERSRKDILQKAREQAEELLRETNRRIENTIREIKKVQAEKEATRNIRERLKEFEQNITDSRNGLMSDEDFERKLQQMNERKERRQKRKEEKAKNDKERSLHAADAQNSVEKEVEKPLAVGDTVRIKGLLSVGVIEALSGKTASVIFGDMRTKMRIERLERAAKPREETLKESLQAVKVSRMTRETIDDRRKNFHQDIDVRGLRGDEALNQVQYFIDDAILVGMPRVRILHGKGNGILKQLIRQYLATVPNVTHFADEHVQFGGAGITVVDF
ncbi:MAG: Smr/MutS family protein [Prevotella sp.]|nr:Smr/MutS family protein [Prevotella sp.]